MSRVLVVGLGNPEAKYAGNRHNIGFMVLDKLGQDAGISMTKSKFKGIYGTGHIEGASAVLLKPQTYMNLSGRSVAPAQKFFDVDSSDVLVVHDELDLPYGRVRLKIGGGHAGHNGLRSMVKETGSNEFSRLRVGIGRPVHGDVSNFVLSDFARGEEQEWLPDLIERSVQAIKLAIRLGARPAMNKVNAT
jgi:PTH1 family peptidyl-tRNA hydrolase